MSNSTTINNNASSSFNFTLADIAGPTSIVSVVLGLIILLLKLWDKYWALKHPGQVNPLQKVENVVKDAETIEEDIQQIVNPLPTAKAANPK